MPKLNTKAIAKAVAERSKQAPKGAPAEDTLSELDRDIVGRTRAQLRIPLLDPTQVKRDLVLVKGAVENALKIVANPATSDRSALVAVRGILEGTNKLVNARWQGYAE